MSGHDNHTTAIVSDPYAFNIPPLPEYVVDIQKKKVYLNDSVWSLNNGSSFAKINWKNFPIKNPLIVWSVQLYLTYLIRTMSASHVRGTFGDITTIKDCYDGELDEFTAFEIEYELPLLLNRLLGHLTQKKRRHQFARVRQWFTWCAGMHIPGFSKMAASELMEIVVGGNPKGQAVLLHHVTKGAFQPIELMLIHDALRKNADKLNLLKGIVLSWLYLALGSNSKNLALLREEDFSYNAETKEYRLKVPRIKKRGVVPRQDLKERRLNPEIGRLVEALIAQNRKNYPVLEEGCARPLFISPGYRTVDMADTNQEYRRHMSEVALRDLAVKTFNHCKIISPISNKPLKIHPRRFRYTFGTIAASQGMPMRILADLLDHSDLQSVEVYYQAAAEFVTKLNATYAKKLAPMIDLFMGEISELPRNEVSKDKLIFGLPSMLKITAIGHCASDKVCNLMPPKTCYTCAKFRAFSDADHSGCLEALTEERNLRYKGDSGIDAILDDTIVACARVVNMVEALGSA